MTVTYWPTIKDDHKRSSQGRWQLRNSLCWWRLLPHPVVPDPYQVYFPSPRLSLARRNLLVIFPMSTGSIAEEGPTAQQAFEQQAALLAAITLLLYETCLTANLELACIWARGRARIILLFMVIRHVQLASLILSAVAPYFNSSSPEMCITFSLVTSISAVIPYFGWAVFLGWRAYALSARSTLVALLVFICAASLASPVMMEIIGTNRVYTTSPPACTTNWKSAELESLVLTYCDNLLIFISTLLSTELHFITVLDISRSFSLLAEIVVLVLTCKKTRQSWVSSKKAGSTSSLPNILYENGVSCFAIGTLLQAVSLVFSIQGHLANVPGLATTISTFRDVLITVLLSRFMLDIAKIGVQTSAIEERPCITGGILTTEWTEGISDVPSQWTLDDEYNGRGFEKEIETFEPKESYEA